jgi:hypothetical protein
VKKKLFIFLILAAIAAIFFAVLHRRSVTRAESKNVSRPISVEKDNLVKVPTQAMRPSTVPQLKDLSIAVRKILDEKAGFIARERAAQYIGKLSSLDREAIYGFLRQHAPGDGQQANQVLKNGLMDDLCQMQPPPDGLRELLAGIYEDSSQDEVLRDYALQHLAAFYRQMSNATGLDPAFQNNELQQTQDVLWQALNETGSTIAGTALLGISQLYQQGEAGFDSQKIASAALKLAGDSASGELTQITAFQVCANLNVSAALPVILASVQQPSTETVQISAIAALGQLGGQAQESTLEGFIQGTDPRLKLPAQHALERIEQRLQQQAGS